MQALQSSSTGRGGARTSSARCGRRARPRVRRTRTSRPAPVEACLRVGWGSGSPARTARRSSRSWTRYAAPSKRCRPIALAHRTRIPPVGACLASPPAALTRVRFACLQLTVHRNEDDDLEEDEGSFDADAAGGVIGQEHGAGAPPQGGARGGESPRTAAVQVGPRMRRWQRTAARSSCHPFRRILRALRRKALPPPSSASVPAGLSAQYRRPPPRPPGGGGAP